MNHSSLDPKYTLTGMPRESLQINRECIINQNMASKPRYKTLNIIFYPKTQQYRQINALFVLGFLKTETHHLNRG